MNKKTLREERTAAEWKNVAQQPAAGGESRRRDSFFCRKKQRIFPVLLTNSTPEIPYNGDKEDDANAL